MNKSSHAVVALLTLLVACKAQAQRTPLAPVELTKVEYSPGGTGDRFNPTTRNWEKYDLERRIVYEESSGNLLLQWNGVDGKRKTIVFHPANRINAVVSAQVEFDASTASFRYTYALRNLPSSRREVQSVYLEVKAGVNKAGALDESWSYSAPLTDYLKTVLKAQGGWTWARTGKAKNGLEPGEAAYGFTVQSGGLPGVVSCFVAGPRGMKGVGEDPPEELMAALDPVSWLIPRGVTVGPVAPPADLEPRAFLRSIEAMVGIGQEQGWILSPGLTEELLASIRSSIASLEHGQPKAAGKTLKELLEQVEKEKEKQLLSEAYALLKFNIEFVLLRIQS